MHSMNPVSTRGLSGLIDVSVGVTPVSRRPLPAVHPRSAIVAMAAIRFRMSDSLLARALLSTRVVRIEL